MNPKNSVIDWLLEESQPSIRYLTLTELLGRTERDSEVKRVRENITKIGWAKDILGKQLPGGSWFHEKTLFMPRFHATFWMLLILSDLGLTKENPRIDRACQLWMKRNASKGGGFSQSGRSGGHLCITGNTARAMIKFGYVDHPKVKRAFEWLVKNQAELGGWSCWNFGKAPYHGRTLDSWEPLGAFVVYPRQKWTRSMKLACQRGAEFFLERELQKQGARWEQWYRFHYPVHYYDLLVGLDFMTALGYSGDKRLGYAVSLLKEKRRRDGRWNLDANRPEESAALAVWSKKHPGSQDMTSFVLEQPGQPSKMITLTAMKVLTRLEVR